MIKLSFCCPQPWMLLWFQHNTPFQIKNLWRIRKYITQEPCHHAVRPLILSRLDHLTIATCFSNSLPKTSAVCNDFKTRPRVSSMLSVVESTLNHFLLLSIGSTPRNAQVPRFFYTFSSFTTVLHHSIFLVSWLHYIPRRASRSVKDTTRLLVHLNPSLLLVIVTSL